MGLAIKSGDVDKRFEFVAYDGSGASKKAIDLTTLDTAVMSVTGGAPIALTVVDAIGGVLEAIVDGTVFAAGAATICEVVLTFLDGSVTTSRTFNVVCTASI